MVIEFVPIILWKNDTGLYDIIKNEFNIVDTFFAGKISPEALSALAKSFPIYFIIIAACVGVTVGGTSLIANSIGENNKKNVLIYFAQTIVFGIILSAFITFIGLYYASDIFLIMGSSKEVVNLGLQYTNVIFSGSIVFISVVALNSLLHAVGDTKTFRNVLILSFLLNIFLNPLFIFGYSFIPAMGMTGIGIKQHGPHNKRFIHLDNLDNSTHPRPTIWSYPA